MKTQQSEMRQEMSPWGHALCEIGTAGSTKPTATALRAGRGEGCQNPKAGAHVACAQGARTVGQRMAASRGLGTGGSRAGWPENDGPNQGLLEREVTELGKRVKTG